MVTTNDISASGIKELLGGWSLVLAELQRRGVIANRNSPIEGYAEWLVAKAFKGTRLANSSKSIDVITANGERLQVKARWLFEKRGSRQLSAIRNLDQIGFDYLVAVLFDRGFHVREAYQISHAAVRRLSTVAGHTNSHRLVITPKVCRDPECTDITAMVREADPEHAFAARSQGREFLG